MWEKETNHRRYTFREQHTFYRTRHPARGHLNYTGQQGFSNVGSQIKIEAVLPNVIEDIHI